MMKRIYKIDQALSIEFSIVINKLSMMVRIQSRTNT